jgi:hypothetical protein
LKHVVCWEDVVGYFATKGVATGTFFSNCNNTVISHDVVLADGGAGGGCVLMPPKWGTAF